MDLFLAAASSFPDFSHTLWLAGVAILAGFVVGD